MLSLSLLLGVMAFDRPLASHEKSARNLVVDTPNLVAFWDFQDKTGSDRVDKSRNR
ncbi:MAG: hypothetical protein H7Y12_02230, partial [Sphingobacteriaceae bacterium]|nr:hypothetical protein [Cytophagaceae bacterium]